MDKQLLMPAEVISQLIDYDADTGRLLWRARPVRLFPPENGASVCVMWNKKFAGRPALNHISKRGYLCGSIKPFHFTAHRVAIAIATGAWPDGQVDHINGDRTDNRLANLMVVTNKDNSRNARIKSTNKSGVTGVFWAKNVNKWAAQIVVDGKAMHLGVYESIDEATAVRRAAQSSHGFHHNHGRR